MMESVFHTDPLVLILRRLINNNPDQHLTPLLDNDISDDILSVLADRMRVEKNRVDIARALYWAPAAAAHQQN